MRYKNSNHLQYHYIIKPYDAVYAIGINNGYYSDGTTPKPSNQFHVEDPQIFIGDYLSQTEVAPEQLYLSNRSIGSTKQTDDPNQYIAEFEARNSITVGNGIYSKNNNPYYLTPDGDFVVDNNSKAIMHSGYEIEFLPGTEVVYGSELIAEIEPYNCENLLIKNLYVENEFIDNKGENYEIEDPKLNIKDQKNEEEPVIRVFPNPNNGQLIVASNIDNKEMIVTIEELTGKQIYQAHFTNARYNDINMMFLENGIYILRAKCSDKMEIYKIIVAK
ncbi:MAG: T9SS type A sorting domain-containing protein [Bacteroidia bacterium]|nr:T9SS type A sorting domain-containing protein [Bacteroidia bacterium]